MSYKRSRAAFESDNPAGPAQHAPYALFGTPLPAYDPEARDDGSYVPIWKQEVTDERGRKRLHGAFTGGWSAGYFNSVGSKEGWTPSTFISSRSSRAKDQKNGNQQAHRPEDFMDDEDLAEQAESQKLETQGGFAGLGSGAEGGAVKGMFSDLFRTSSETMGAKLLQRMGWRQGQGVGPKIRRRAKGDEKGETHLFAPEDSRMINFSKKTDRKGLGFAGEERPNGGETGTKDEPTSKDEDDNSYQDARILQSSRSTLLSKPKKIKKTGIGIGVLNDTGSDDEDPYAMGPQINYNRIIDADKKKKKGGLVASNAGSTVQKPMSKSKTLAQRPVALSGFRKCHDGRLPLGGFVVTITPLAMLQENNYPPPSVPEGWRPARLSGKSEVDKTQFQSTAEAAKASTLDPTSRAALLGEQQLPGKSIFDFISPAVRDRLVSASGKTNLPPALGEGAPAGYQASEAEKRRTLWDLVPQLDKQTAAVALQRGTSGWMPYAEDEDKRARYRYFLELRAGMQSNLPERPETFLIDEWVKELREFAQAAEVFKPISGLMASRFTSSSSTPKLATDAPDRVQDSFPSQKEDDPAERAAKMGMYGPLTRSRQPFYPTRLLCKRFNVKPPANISGGDPTGAPHEDGSGSGRLDVVSQAKLDRMMREASFTPAGGFVTGGVEGGKDLAGGGGEKVAEVVDAEKNAALEGQRAGEAVFKAIFGSDDENE